MNFSLTNRSLLIALAVIFGLALVSDIISESDVKYYMEARSFEIKLQKAEEEALYCLGKLSDDGTVFTDAADHEDIYDNRVYSLYKYSGQELSAWTSNSYAMPRIYDPELFSEKLVFLDNRWVMVNEQREDEDIFICLINIFRDYGLENEYIQSGFNPEFDLDIEASISTDRDVGYPVRDKQGHYLFSLRFEHSDNFITSLSFIPVVLWLLFFFVLLALIDRLARWFRQKGLAYLPFLSSLQAAVIVYLVFLLLDKPGIFLRMDIFSSFSFNPGPLIPSPGHLFLLSILFLFVCLEFYLYFPKPGCSGKKPRQDFFTSALFLIIASFMFFVFSRLLNILVMDSNIHFKLYEILDLNIFTIISLSAAAMILAGTGVYLLRVAAFCRNLSLRTVLFSLLLSALVLYFLHFLSGTASLIHIVAYLLLGLQAWMSRSEKVKVINISVTFALVAAAYTAYIIPSLTWQKETEKLKVISVNFSNSNDIYGEALLLDMWPELETDSLLNELLSKDYLDHDDVDKIYTYLDNAYFSDYWDNYEKVYTICEDESPLFFKGDTGRVENCFDFFRSRIGEMGIPLHDSSLVFLDNKSGRPYYLGQLYYKKKSGGQNGLFIELINMIRYTRSGYPELLIDKRYDKQVNTDDYSIAKYINDSLVIQTGEYPFAAYLNLPADDSSVFSNIPADGNTDHFIYNEDNITVVIARPALKFVDVLITFNYLFIVFFILHLLISLIIRPPYSFFPGRLNFTQKLQFAFIGLLLGSLVAIGTVVVFLSINQYHEKHYENIEEKLASVYIELDHKLSGVDVLHSDWNADGYPSLDALLVKFSNVFKTDINLYDTDGMLMATSRKELFEKDLKSERMNFRAFSSLRSHVTAQFIHIERIAELSYLSAYAPFVNNQNEVLAFLNLPYFNMQGRMSEETSNLIVAMINFSMLLLVISLGIAVFISVRITSPLRMLQRGLASVKLEEKSKPLEYRGHDEISELVNQYNKMLDELQVSAVKLARSEREDAWRDMAKQIAHEIKNPLTPMKLNVQQLYKKWKDKPEDFEDSLQNFTQYQIEQIDNLSSIATEFSNFARMPKASPRETNLVDHINAVAELYSDIRNVDLIINFNELREVKVYADKEQINSMLSNIFRNAVQSIPGGRHGIINISLSVENKKALIKVEDNGVGIPESLRDKLFTPNFTTKSSGMGLGLAIVKRVVETANGEIWFESEPGKGSVFYVEYPLLTYKR